MAWTTESDVPLIRKEFLFDGRLVIKSISTRLNGTLFRGFIYKGHGLVAGGNKARSSTAAKVSALDSFKLVMKMANRSHKN